MEARFEAVQSGSKQHAFQPFCVTSTTGTSERKLEGPQPPAPSPQATVPASCCEAQHRKHLGSFHRFRLTQSPRDGAGGMFHSPSLLAFHSWSPAPFVTPSPPHSAACKTSCLLQAPQAPRKGAATPRPGFLATTCKGKFSACPCGQDLGSAPADTRDLQPSRCFQTNIACLLDPTEGGPASAGDDSKQGSKNK